jgi:hypothetical protein
LTRNKPAITFILGRSATSKYTNGIQSSERNPMPGTPLTDLQISQIASWAPIYEGFGRDEPETSERIKRIVQRINASAAFRCDSLEDDGLANYFVLFAYTAADVPPFVLARRVDGFLIYFSACGPFAVVGRSRKCAGSDFIAHDPLKISNLIDLATIDGELEKAVLEAIRCEGYELLPPQEASQPLPVGVEPEEYCYDDEPRDRVFHAMFANTD